MGLERKFPEWLKLEGEIGGEGYVVNFKVKKPGIKELSSYGILDTPREVIAKYGLEVIEDIHPGDITVGGEPLTAKNKDFKKILWETYSDLCYHIGLEYMDIIGAKKVEVATPENFTQPSEPSPPEPSEAVQDV